MNAPQQSPEIGREILAAGYRTNLHDQGEGFPAPRAGVRTIPRGTARADNLNLAVVGNLPRLGQHDPLSESLPGIDAMPGIARRGDRSKHQVVCAHSGGYDRLRGNQYQPTNPA